MTDEQPYRTLFNCNAPPLSQITAVGTVTIFNLVLFRVLLPMVDWWVIGRIREFELMFLLLGAGMALVSLEVTWSNMDFESESGVD